MADTGGSAAAKRMGFAVPEKVQLHLAMLALQFGYAGFHVVSRAALNMGISKIVFPVYRNILALLLLLPFAYFLEKKDRPPLNWKFALSFSCWQSLGIEVVRLNRKDGISKVMGTLLCVVWGIRDHTLQGADDLQPDALARPAGPVLKKYPARLSVTSYQCFFGVIQFLIIAAFCERDPQAWLVHSGAELFSVFYAGVVASGIAFAVQIWCIDKGGPVFVAVYQPVQTLVVALVASVVLGEEFYLGGIIGAVLIIIGLYFVLWGKNEEAKFARAAVAIQAAGDHSRAPTSHIIKSSLSQPLLQSTENA
nr:protein WALLS ARE THIN 1-like [Ipomoea batatas]